MTPARRVFFALWPTRRVRERVAAVSRDAVARSGGRAVAPANYHITVAFLGAVDAAGLQRALAVPPVHTGPVDLVLDTLGGFARARVSWLAPSQVPASLQALEQALWLGLARAGFNRENRPFRPHLTLARKVRAVHDQPSPLHGQPVPMRGPSAPIQDQPAPIRWRATRLALVESVDGADGVRYRPLAFWSLGRAFVYKKG